MSDETAMTRPTPDKPLLSLRVRLAALVLIVVAPIFAIVFSTHIKHRREDVERAGANALQLARLASEHHDRLVEGTRQLLAGLRACRKCATARSARCDQTFAEVLRDNPIYGSIVLLNRDGDMISPLAVAARKLNVRDQVWFARMRGSRGFSVGGYQHGRVSNRLVLVCSQPLFDEQGNARGGLAVSLRTDWLERFARAANLPDGSTLTVIGRDGTVWARHPDGARWVGRTVPETPIVRDVVDAGVAEAADVGGEAAICAFAPLGVSSVGGGGGGGAPSATAASPVYVLVSLPRQAVVAPANRQLAVELAGVALVTLVTLALAVLGSRLWFLRWMDRLATATHRVAAGELSARAELTGGPAEFRRLGESFDEMAVAVEQAARAARRRRPTSDAAVSTCATS